MSFNTRTILHIAGILATAFLLLWCVVNTRYYATMLTLSLLLAFQVYALLRFVSITNRQLSRFLDAVEHSDFSLSFRQPEANDSFAALGRSIDDVLDRFREERSAREAQASFLVAFVEQVPIAVLALDEDNRIEVSNKALRRLTGHGELRHLGQIAAFDASLARTIGGLAGGDERLLKLKSGSATVQLKLSCSLLRLRGRAIRLVSIQDIGNELEAAELNAWQNLIRVMTHEIMNSITPITSLAGTTAQYLHDVEAQLDSDDEPDIPALKTLLQDAGNAMDTIGNRSHGLMRFVESYRTLTRLPEPEMASFRVQDMLQNVHTLLEDTLARQQVALTVSCNPVTLALTADREMLEQALLNLLLNAVDAVAGREQPQIRLSATLRDRGGVNILVEDNGTGIGEDNLDNIFIPFFTTKRGGSGIGLSVVKQIVNLNGGQIVVSSQADVGTSFRLGFPA